MILYWHKKENKDNLLLIFNGWGCDNNIISGLEKDEYDILLIYNYTTVEPEKLECTKNYVKVDIIAWSFGVLVADICLRAITNVDKLIAVNGTLKPVHDEEGIPCVIFRKTLEDFNETAKKKFFIRIMGGMIQYNRNERFLPKRTTEDQLFELKALEVLSCREYKKSGKIWTICIMSEEDKIFPYKNMKTAWPEIAQTTRGNHFPEFQQLVNTYII